jgi:hypothetical protein
MGPTLKVFFGEGCEPLLNLVQPRRDVGGAGEVRRHLQGRAFTLKLTKAANPPGMKCRLLLNKQERRNQARLP